MIEIKPTKLAQPSGENSLPERIARGDRLAETEFVRQFERGVRLLVRRHCRPNEPDVDDFVQDILTSVLQKLREGALRESDALNGYVRQTVVFVTTTAYRKRYRRGEYASLDEVEPLESGDNPEQHHAKQESLGLVSRLLQEMSTPRDRELLRRFYLQEQSREQVCEALQIEPEHFHRVIFRARARLRLLMQQAKIDPN